MATRAPAGLGLPLRVAAGVAAGLALALAAGALLADRLDTVLARLPYILVGNQAWWPIRGGFAANLFISFACMGIATVLGAVVGLVLVSPVAPLRRAAFFLTHFFRNSPWLVILYSMLFLLPFQLDLGFATFAFPATVKAVIALALPVGANIAEIVRGAVQSIPSGQWEAARSLGFTRGQILRLVILPQAVRRMIPPWMNWYAILTMATTLANLVGVEEGLTAVRRVVEADGERYAIPFYAVLMVAFFAYCYPIARWTQRLERRFT